MDESSSDDEGIYNEIGCQEEVTLMTCEMWTPMYPMDLGTHIIQMDACKS